MNEYSVEIKYNSWKRSLLNSFQDFTPGSNSPVNSFSAASSSGECLVSPRAASGGEVFLNSSAEPTGEKENCSWDDGLRCGH